MKHEKCKLSHLLAAFLVGVCLLLGFEQFKMIERKQMDNVDALYTIYLVISLMTIVISLAAGSFSPLMLSLCLIGHVLGAHICYFLGGFMKEVLLLHASLVAITASMGAILLLQACAAYSGNPATAVAFVCGTILSFKLPDICAAVESFVEGLRFGIVLKFSHTEMLLQVKCVTLITALAVRYALGQPCDIRKRHVWKKYKDSVNPLNLFAQGNPMRKMLDDFKAESELWYNLVILAVLITFATLITPDMALVQLPIGPSWLEDVKSWQNWALGLGMLTGVFMPFPHSQGYMLPAVSAVAIILNYICAHVFFTFSTIPSIKPSAVTILCTITCFIDGYALSYGVGLVVAIFFLRKCRNFRIGKMCCEDIYQTGCMCTQEADYFGCGPTGGTIGDTTSDNEAAASPVGTNHIIWVVQDPSTQVTSKCKTVKCTCTANGGTNAGHGCRVCARKQNVCVTKDLLKSTFTDNTGASGAAGASAAHQGNSGQWTAKCFCHKNMGRNCGTFCKNCGCTNGAKTNGQANRCVDWIATEQAQHYVLKNVSSSTCNACDLTLLLEGVPFGSKGEPCCIPQLKKAPDAAGWKKWCPKTDRVYIGYLDAACAACSLVEIRKYDFANEYSQKLTHVFPNNFNINRIGFGSCCHASFFLLLQCKKRDKYPHVYCTDYPYKDHPISYIYFTSAAVLEDEVTKLNPSTGAGSPGAGGTPSAQPQPQPTPPAPSPAATAPTSSDASGTTASLGVDDYKKCCFGIATKVFTYYRYVSENEGESRCVPSAAKSGTPTKHCECTGGKCSSGCCVKVSITDEFTSNIDTKERRLRVAALFWIMFVLFIMLERFVGHIYTRTNMGAPYNFTMNLNKLQQTVAGDGWDAVVKEAVSDTKSTVYHVDNYGSDAGLDNVLSSLKLCLPDTAALKLWIKANVETHFPEYAEDKAGVMFHAACVSLGLQAVETCIKDKMPGFQEYESMWEKRWTKEYDNYQASLFGVVQKYVHMSLVAQALAYDLRPTKSGLEAYQKVREHCWGNMMEELKLFKKVEKHERHLEKLQQTPTKEAPQTFEERLQLVWQTRIKHLVRWAEQGRCLYDWEGFITSYNQLQQFYESEAIAFGRKSGA
ncbi:efflux ABC permease, putative [Babesia caballi]|uniref:Efflux ABC permease, putative n=1 Tax=Babesia caballi TaxID=5871 RepID=A0AAV4LVB2_BABCB|nr:efflux ABC permease, putative [Babesia caballi]